MLYDGDNAGIKAALRGIDLLLEEGLDIKVVLLPEGEDPDSYAQKHSRQERGFLGCRSRRILFTLRYVFIRVRCSVTLFAGH